MSNLITKTKKIKKTIEVEVEETEITGVNLELTIEEATALRSLLGITNATNQFIGRNTYKIWDKLGKLGFGYNATPKRKKSIDTASYLGDLVMEDCIYPGKKTKEALNPIYNDPRYKEGMGNMDGYRFLEVKEVLVSTDEVFEGWCNKWSPTHFTGKEVLPFDGPGVTACIYRRKV